MRDIVLAAMSAAILAGAAAGPALASTTMTFRIDVTGSTGSAAAFTTPLQETFTLEDGVLSGGGPATDLMGDISGADALTAGLKSQIDLTGSADYSNWDLGTSSFTPPIPGFPPIVNTQGDIFENVFGAGGAYQQSIDGGALPGYLPPSQSAGGLADFFQQGQTLTWYEAVYDGGFQQIAGYTGTATLISFSGAPEPGSWALMFAGLGCVGLVLRRREVRSSAT